MGSAILVDPAMRKLQKEINANVHFAIFKKNKPSLDLLKTVPEENIYTIRENNMAAFIFDTVKFVFWTRTRKIDAVIDLELFSRFTALLTGFSGAPNKVGFHAYYNEGLYRGSFLTHKVAYNPHIHIAKNFIALVNALLAHRREIPFSKTLIADEEIKLAKAAIGDEDKKNIRGIVTDCFEEYSPQKHKIILINPNASELLIQRRWPPQYLCPINEKYSGSMRECTHFNNRRSGEREEAGLLKEQVQSQRVINFAGKITFAQLPATVQHFRVYDYQ